MTLKDFEYFSDGPWIAFASNNAPAKGSDTIRVSRRSFPNDTIFDWKFPDVEGESVYSYVHLAWGNFVGGVAHKNDVIPTRIDRLASFTEDLTFEMRGARDDYNVLSEMFPTLVAGDATTQIAEVGVFRHAPPATRRYIRTGRPIGTVVESGRSWTVTQITSGVSNPAYPKGLPFYVFTARNPAAVQGRVDIRKLLEYLVAQGEIAGTAYINGHGTGVEPIKGSGSLTIKNIQIRMTAKGDLPEPGRDNIPKEGFVGKE